MSNTFDLQRYLKEGWELFNANMANLVVATLVFLAVNFAASFIPLGLGSILVSGPITGGMYFLLLDLMKGEPFNVMRIFDGFKKFVPLVLVGLLTSIFIAAGMIFLILPGLLVAGWYLFPYLFVVDEDMDFWPAMEASREIGFQNHLNVFLMIIVLIMINIAGALALLVGLLVSIPLSFCVILKAYQDIHGIKGLAVPATSSGAMGFTPPPPPPPPPPSTPE
ncbi:MAG: hypothetical protein HY751_06325 [Nitrospinae bacterium]|nr:hypothetical protein [Nitrospinota bacterium]